MKLINKMKKAIFNPSARFGYLSKLGLLNWMNDENYLKKEYALVFGKKLDLRHPCSFNEKIQWLKLNDRKEKYVKMVDKYEVKKYVSNVIGDGFIVPTLGIYDRFDDIDFEKLPNQFVMKCTHDSGGLVVCKDKNSFDKNTARKKINFFLKRKYYYLHREWPYKNVRPRIIIEKYLEDRNGEIRDYKFFCFNGEPKLLYVSDGSHSKHPKIAFFDTSFNQLPIRRLDYEDYEVVPEKPIGFKKMLKLAGVLSERIPHVRVDFYNIDGKIYFSEFTFSTGSGYVPFLDEKWDEELGSLIDLSLVKNEIKKSII